MQCLLDLMSLFLLAQPAVPPIVLLVYMFYQVKSVRPCVPCALAYLLVILTFTLTSAQKSGFGDWLGIAPETVEMNLLWRMQADRHSFDFGNLMGAFVRFLVEPRMKIYQ